MALTRIKTNQITDLAVTNAKLANATIAGGKLANNLTYGSDLTVSGNLTVSGTTTAVSTTNTTVDDALIALASGTSGAPSEDAGLIVNRGSSNNMGWFWDETASEWVAADVGSEAGLTAGNVTISAYSDIHIADLTAAAGSYSSTLSVSGSAALNGGITVDTNNFTVDGTTGAVSTASTLDVTGAATLSSTLSAGASTLASADVTNNATVGGTLGVTGASTLASADVTNNATVGGTLGVTGEATLASATVSDLTSGRIVLAGASGAIQDSGNLTFNGTTLAVTGAATVSTTLDVEGASSFSSNVTMDTAADFAMQDAALTPSTVYSIDGATGNTVIAGTLGAGETTVSSATISDLTSGRVVLAGTSGAVEDSGNLTFNGSTLSVTGSVSASGDVAGATATISGAATVGGTFSAGETTVSSATVSDLTSGRVVLAGTSGAIEDSGNLTFNGTTLAVTGAATVSTTFDVEGASSFSSDITMDTAADLIMKDNASIPATVFTVDGATGNMTVAGDTALNGAVTVAASQTISMGANKVTNVADPALAQDAATKAYVDSQSSSSSQLGISGDTGADTVVVGTDTFNFAGTAGEIETTVSNNQVQIGLPTDVVVAGNLTVQGTTVTVDSTVITVEDPVFTLGTSGLSADAGKDRGIEFYYYDAADVGNENKTGFFGWDNSADTFTFLTDATNTGEVFSGSAGNFVMAGLTATTGAFSSNATVGGTLGVTGAATLSSTLDVTSAATLSSTLSAGASTLASADVTNNATVGGTLGVTGASTLASASVTGNATVGGTLGVTGEATLASATVSDLTSGRVVLAGLGGIIEDSGNLTFNGTTLAVTGAATVSTTFDVEGASSFSANVTMDTAADFAMQDAALTPATVYSIDGATGNTVIAGTLGAGETTLSSATVSDLTSGRIVLAGASGAIQDDGNLTFNGSTLSVTGSVSASGDVAGATATISGNATVGGTFGVTGATTLSSTLAAGATTITGTASVSGEATLASATVSDLTSGRVVLAGASGAIEDSGNLTFNGTTLAVTGNETVSGTFDVEGASSFSANVTMDTAADFAMQDAAFTPSTVYSIDGATGNTSIGGTLAVTGEATFATHANFGDGDIVKMGDAADLQIQHNGTDSVIANSTGILAIDGAATSSIRVNEAGADVDFVVEGDTNASLFVVDAGSDAVAVGGAVSANATFKINATDAMVMPVGTTAQRPTGENGMFRYNSTTASMEYYSGAQWNSISTDFTIATSQTFSGDDLTVAFTLSALSGADSYTSAGVLVMLNGVVQEPTTVYGVSGTTLTFTSAPATGDVIEVRKFTTTNTVVAIADTDGDTMIQVEESADEDVIRFDIAGVEMAALSSAGLSMSSNKITDVTDPSNAQDAATKAYVDASSSLLLASDNTWTGSQRIAVTADNDGSFDMNAGQAFTWTPAGADTLEFTNEATGQVGIVRLDNSSGYAITLGAEIEADASAASTLSTAGAYMISYFCYDGVNVSINYSEALV